MAKHIINKEDLKGFIFRYPIASSASVIKKSNNKSLLAVGNTTTNRIHYEVIDSDDLKAGASTLDMAIDLYNEL